ncbi:NACHT domain-containing protein [Streptomyces stelliscabiei]|uniref:NACHT domain-containing protein n=1 Tax=Streptomyces stelliscabiei TaxID=146820 RepID=UPI002FF0FF1E
MTSSSPVQNVVVDSTIGTLVQIGVINGPSVLQFVQQAPLPVEALELAAQTLAKNVFRQWREEANAWDIAKPEPIRVRWRASWPDADHPYNVGGEVAGQGDRVGTMAEAFLALRQRRLVVLGEAGAGKTTLAVLLTLDLLTRRLRGADGGPVPVFLSLETWQAERDHLRTWLARRIAEDHPGLPRVDGRHPAERLVSDGQILPVLDGLDELPVHRRAFAVEALNHALRDGDPLILTSRTAAYRDVLRDMRGISAAAVVEALPVRGQDAVAYLESGTSPLHLDRWRPVFEELRESPPEPVALALSNPLMLWLARRGYAQPHTDPAELTDTTRLPTPASIEEHLLEHIVPAVFSPLPHAPDRLHAPGAWDPVRARRHLAFLATFLADRHRTEFAWWQLHRHPLVRVLTVLVVPALCAVTAWIVGASGAVLDRSGATSDLARAGAELPFATALVLTGLLLMFQRLWFRRRDGRPRRLANPFRLGAALRSAGRATSLGRALKAASVVALPTLLLSGWALTTPFAAPLVAMAVCSTLLAPLLLVAISAPSDTEDATSPDELLRDERRALVCSLVTVAPLIGVGQGAMDWLLPEVSGAGVVWALLGWFGAAVVLVPFSPWSRWLLAKVSLAALDRVPWSLMEFLRHAHRAGLLQRSGGVYRFRNLRLQEHFSRRGRRDGRDGRGGGGGRDGRGVRDGSDRRDGPASAGSARNPASREATPTGRHVFSVTRPGYGKPLIAPGRSLFDAEQEPLAGRPNWAVREDEHGFRAWGRHRGLVLGHWNTVALAAPLHFVLFAAYGDGRNGFRFVLFWLAVGVAVTLSGLLRRPLILDLQLTHDRLTYTVGRHQGVVPWRDTARVEVSKVSQRGWKGATYGVVITLYPGAPSPHRKLRVGERRYVVLPLMSLSPAVPADLGAALARYAGARWSAPGPASSAPGEP